jgi:hypothetical protein
LLIEKPLGAGAGWVYFQSTIKDQQINNRPWLVVPEFQALPNSW